MICEEITKMEFIYTLNTPGAAPEIMVDAALFNSDADTINSVIGDLSPGTIIYTAGYGTIKQKGLDGEWTEVQ